MVSALDSGSSDPGSSFCRGTALSSWATHFTLTVPLSAQLYKWVPANLLLGNNLSWISIPSRGSTAPSRLMLQKPELWASQAIKALLFLKDFFNVQFRMRDLHTGNHDSCIHHTRNKHV